MSKIKAPKEKITGMDILYRVVMACAAIAVPIAAFFSELIYFVVESDVFSFVAQMKGDEADTGATENAYSIYKFINTYGSLMNNQNSDSTKSFLWDSLEALHKPIIATIAFLLLAVVIAVVIFFVACFSRKKLPQLILSIAGIGAMIGLSLSFRALALPIVNGEVNLSTFFGSSIISSVLPYIASVKQLALVSAYNIMLIIFIGMIIWTGSYMVIDAGEKKKKIKKA